jgi:hypothetical protein
MVDYIFIFANAKSWALCFLLFEEKPVIKGTKSPR